MVLVIAADRTAVIANRRRDRNCEQAPFNAIA